MRIEVVVDEDKVVRRRFPDQCAKITRRIAHPEHPHVEERPHPVQRGEVIREGRDAQSLKRAWSTIENVPRDVPIDGGESSSLRRPR